MGIIRKLTSASTLGAVDFRSDKERIARSSKKTSKQSAQQTKIMQQQLALQQQMAANAASGANTGSPAGPPAGWMLDPQGSGRQRWWDGSSWTEHYQA